MQEFVALFHRGLVEAGLAGTLLNLGGLEAASRIEKACLRLLDRLLDSSHRNSLLSGLVA
jgi:hypothetical protein